MGSAGGESAEEFDEIAAFGGGERVFEVGGHGAAGEETAVGDLIGFDEVEFAFRVLQGVVVVRVVTEDAVEGLAGLEVKRGALVAGGDAAVGVEDGFADQVKRALVADAGEVGTEEAALSRDGVALGATAFAEVEGGAGLFIPFDGDFVGWGDERADVGQDLPELVVGEVGGGHVGTGEAELDGVEQDFVGRAGDGAAGDEIGATTAFAHEAVTTGTGVQKDLATGGNVFGLERGPLREGGEGEEQGEDEDSHRAALAIVLH